MVKIKHAFVISLVMAGTGAVIAAYDISAYSVPKDHPPISQTASAPASLASAASASSIKWTTPAGWEQLPATPIRIGNFRITGADGRKAEVAVTSFPGTVGTELDNINRWRSEVGLASVSAADISSQAVTVDSLEGKIYDFAGPSASTAVVSVRRQGATWFFKLRGDKTIVGGARPAFLRFMESVHFTGDVERSPAPNAEISSGPHSQLAAAPALTTADNQPVWNPPSTWTENAPGAMIAKSFSVSGAAEQNANITISVFPGDVGGVFANVNRWRAQMGLAPIQQRELSSATEALQLTGGSGVLMDLANPNAQAGGPSRLVAVIVPQGDKTWFYKLAGPESVVAAEKDSFINFVRAARYHD